MFILLFGFCFSARNEKQNVFALQAIRECVCVYIFTTTNKLAIIKILAGSSELPSVRISLFFACAVQFKRFVYALKRTQLVYRFELWLCWCKNFTNFLVFAFLAFVRVFVWDTTIVISSKGTRTFIIASCKQQPDKYKLAKT